MKEFFNQLAQDFGDKDYAHAYMEAHTISRIAAQIHAIRKQRGWSQQELAEKSGIAQERISKIESADFTSLTMKTLQKLSRAFDVHLHIAFESFSEGIMDIANLHSEELEVASRPTNLEMACSSAWQLQPEEATNKATTNTIIVMMLGPEAGHHYWRTPNIQHASSSIGEYIPNAHILKKANSAREIYG